LKLKIVGKILCILVLFFLYIPNSLAQGHFLYSNNNGGLLFDLTNTVSGFSIGANGRLIEIPGSPFSAGGTVSPSGYIGTNYIEITGDFLYAANAGSSSIAGFSINPATGFLTPVSGSPFPIEGITWSGISLSATPDGKFLIAVNNHRYTISVYKIAADGSLSLVNGSPYQLNDQTGGVKVSPNGKFLAVALIFKGLAMYSIDPTGTLTPVEGSPFLSAPNRDTSSIAITCDSTLLFATSGSDYSHEDVNEGRAITVSVYRIAPNGALTFLRYAPPIPGFGDSAGWLLLSPEDKNLFVSDYSYVRAIAAYQVGANGNLTAAPGAPFSIGDIDPGTAPLGMMTDPTGEALYTGIYPTYIGAFQVASDGALSLIPPSPYRPRNVTHGSIASLAAYPAKVCTPTMVFDLCIQDESSGDLLRLNTTTSAYQLTRCLNGFTLSGTARLTRRGCTLTVQDLSTDRRIMAQIDTCSNRATASIQIFSQGGTFTLTDRNMTNNTCHCPNSN
jgi:6-phosphogluconolactonase (cycloisomerase 2 family)